MTAKLSDVCTVKYGKDHKRIADGRIPVYGSGGIMRYIDTALYDKKSVLIPRKGTLDNLFFVNEPFWTVDTLFYTEIDETKVIPEYLYYFLKTRNLAGMNVGTAVPSLTVAVLNEIKIDVPSLSEQQIIADTLSALDARLAENIMINHHLEQIAQAIFKSWFIDFEPFGGEMPSDWKSVVLGELCETVTKGTTPTTLKKQFVSQGINFVKAESILDDHSLDFGKLAFIDDETNTLLSRSVIRENDIIFTIAGTLGRFAYVGADLLPANTNQAVAIIRANTSKINPVTLYSFFVGGLHSDFYTKNIQQAVQANLSLTTIKSLPLSLPPKETLSEYSALVEPIFEQTFQNYAESRRLADLRDTLLPKLMSGELSVADLGDAK